MNRSTDARLYKTKPRNVFSDPITGVTKRFNTNRGEIASFDTIINKYRLPNNYQPTAVMDANFGEPKERISGALRKEV